MIKFRFGRRITGLGYSSVTRTVRRRKLIKGVSSNQAVEKTVVDNPSSDGSENKRRCQNELF